MDVLNQHTLVLNKSWTAIGTTTVKEAVILLSRGSAKALCTSTFIAYSWDNWIENSDKLQCVTAFIKTPNMNVPAPQVIILTNYDAIYRTTVKFSTRAVYRRDNYTCAYCNKKKKVEDLSIDHIIPKAKKGKTDWLNCITACFECNNRKSDQTLQESGMKLHFKPTVPKWSPIIHVKPEARPDSWKKLLKDEHWS